ncbi:MAG: CDP-glycerol glycerophosphotransferase family protein [Patescibacteria group bacterium]
MKTVFLTCFHPFISKNILNTDVFKILMARKDLKIILLVPEHTKKFFEKNYGSENVLIEGIDTIKFSISRVNNFFVKTAFFFIYSHWIKRTRWDYVRDNRSIKNCMKYFLFMWLTFFLSASKTAKKLFRYFDQHYSPNDFFDKQYETYKPDLVFTPDVYTDFDQAVIKEAKNRGIFVIGMIRSWDNNVSKGLMRFMPDKLIVNNEVIKKEAMELHNYPEKNILVAGLPQFDDYLKAPFHSREDFFKSVGGDPKKRTILYAPGGPEDFGNTNLVICRFLKEAKTKGILPPDIQILISNHPHRPNDFQEFAKDKDFAIISIGTNIRGSRKNTEIPPEDNLKLADMLYYSDVLIWMASSIGLDMLVFDKPEIVINFDGLKNRPYWSSIRRFHDEDHMVPFFKTGGIKIAKNLNDMTSALKAYLEDPKLDAEGRERARVQQLWRLDGRAGERIANFILSFV